MSDTPRPRLLILCFDPIAIDPRVMKQVRLFADRMDITTCSPGPSPHPSVEHIELDLDWQPRLGRVREFVDEVAREREWFWWTYRGRPLVRQAMTGLRGRRFDAAIANDIETIGVANAIVGPTRVHADLHEFFPGLPQPDDHYGARQRRYYEWILTRQCARSASSTTVGAEIAERYHEYSVFPGVVTNSAPYRDAAPHPTAPPIRLVHSGNPFRDRGLEEIMRAAAATTSDVTLDLYLTHNVTADRAALVQLADELGPRVTVHEPVAQNVLVETLAQYDVGIYVLPPTSDNAALALPNKFFDFLQARLGVVIGPSVEMARITREYGCGIVTTDFSCAATIQALNSLTTESVDEWKAAAHVAAKALSSEASVVVWDEKVSAILAQHTARR